MDGIGRNSKGLSYLPLNIALLRCLMRKWRRQYVWKDLRSFVCFLLSSSVPFSTIIRRPTTYRRRRHLAACYCTILSIKHELWRMITGRSLENFKFGRIHDNVFGGVILLIHTLTSYVLHHTSYVLRHTLHVLRPISLRVEQVGYSRRRVKTNLITVPSS